MMIGLKLLGFLVVFKGGGRTVIMVGSLVLITVCLATGNGAGFLSAVSLPIFYKDGWEPVSKTDGSEIVLIMSVSVWSSSGGGITFPFSLRSIAARAASSRLRFLGAGFPGDISPGRPYFLCSSSSCPAESW
ncbi:MAG: hypothetical protein JL50_19680 [Peptococcaceae bacterium BICA1-7]|nr:MAG: hypothetical protein JL50_19680 [Peptococcaceae bacterium BICA1-7]